MKKVILMFLLIIFFTGCSVKDITKKDVDLFVDNAFKSPNQPINKSYKGYKFALPRGYNIVDKREDNYILLSRGDYYYLYIDIVSYFYKKDNEQINIKDVYYYKEIGDKGFVKIIKNNNDEYFVKIVYNYSKIEVKTKTENLKYVIENGINMVKSVEYNDITLSSMIGENILDYKEENFNLFESKREEGTFLDYIEEYENYEEEEVIKDDDFIQ